MGYLKAFFNQPTINQISAAEFERFSEPKPRPKPAAEAETKVVDLNAKRPGAPTKPIAPIGQKQPVAKPVSKPAASSKSGAAQNGKTRISPPARPQSFLSRLIGRQLD